MKLRLTQAGFENYTGQMGVVQFKDGLSESDVLPIDAIRIAAAIGAEWEDGSAANVGDMYLNNMHTPAYVGMAEKPVEEVVVEAKTEQTETTAKPAAAFTQEELAQIADEKGIAGLREVADPLGVKGTSIVGLMEAIMKAQGIKAQPKAE